MQIRFRAAVLCGLLVFTSLHHIDAQILRDSASLKLVRQAIDRIYEMRFPEAEAITGKISNAYPSHPVVMLLRGMTIYWKNYPVTQTSPARESYENILHECMRASEKYESEDEAEFLLATLCARGMLLLFYANNDLNSKLYSLARTSYRYLRRSFDFTGKYPDFYFFTGLYLYYREAYPEAHPIYKPLLVLFPRGDKAKGMKELQIAFEKSIFLKSEASDFLSSNYKYYENDFQSASRFSKTLFDHYPGNIEYRTDCIENYLLTGRYDDAEKLINEADLKNSAYFNAMMKIFRGIIDEKKYRNMTKAEKEYSEGVREITAFGDYGAQHAAYGYFGLSRISALNNDPAGRKAYRKKAEELTDFREINFDKP